MTELEQVEEDIQGGGHPPWGGKFQRKQSRVWCQSPPARGESLYEKTNWQGVLKPKQDEERFLKWWDNDSGSS